MPRILDLIAVIAVAVVLLLPRPSVTAQPALVGAAVELDAFAELENARAKNPASVDAALALADAELGVAHPDWTIATLASFAALDDWRVHLTLATARAERLESERAVTEARRVEALCASATARPACAPGTEARVGLIKRSMEVLADEHIDPAKDPVRAREQVSKVLHSAKYNLPSGGK